MAVKVTVYGTADMKQIENARTELDKLESQAKQTASGTGGAFSGLQGVITSTGAKIASVMGSLGLTTYLKDSLEVAGKVQTSQLQMKAAAEAVTPALNDNADAWNTYNAKVTAALQKNSDISAFSKGSLRDALTQLITTTGDSAASIDLLGVTSDLARRKGMDLEQAAVLVGKAWDGNVTSLKRLGIELPEGAKGMQAIDALQQRVAGSAAAYGESAAGSQEKFANALKSLQNTIGTALLPTAEKFMAWITDVIKGFQSMPGPIQNVIVTVGAIAGAALLMAPFIESILVVSKALGILKAAQAIATAAQWLWNAAVLANPIIAIIAGVIALVGALVWFFTQTDLGREIWAGFVGWLTDVWNGFTQWFGDAVAAVVNWVGHHWGLLLSLLIGPIGLVIQWVVENWSGIMAWFRGAIDGFVGFWRDAWGGVSHFFSNIWDKIRDALGNAGHWLLDVGRNIVEGLANGIRNAWDNLVNMVKGLTDGFIGGIKDMLGIHSPSLVFAGIGNNIAAGMAEGIQAGAPSVTKALSGLTAAGTANVNVNGSGASAFGSSSSRSVVVAEGAIQISFAGSTSVSDAKTVVQDAFAQLVRELRAS